MPADRLGSVPAETAQLLRAAALLGGRFVPADLAVMLRRPVSSLAAALEEAVAAGILAGSGPELVFRHPLIRQALYEGMPLALRTALHAEAARELAARGRAERRRAAVLSGRPGGLGHGVAHPGSPPRWSPGHPTRGGATATGNWTRRRAAARSGAGSRSAWSGLSSPPGPSRRPGAAWALTVLTGPARRAEPYWILAHAQVSEGRGDDAIDTIRQALAPGDMPGDWHARMLALLSRIERGSAGGLGAAQASPSGSR